MSGRSVGRLSAGRRITDHGTRQQSHGRRRSRRVHLSRAVLAPPVLGEGVPGIGRVGIRPRFGDRPISHAEWQTSTGAAGPPTGGSAARHVAQPMTTPVTVSQDTNTLDARTFPPRPAIVAVPGGRRGEAPGRRTSRRVPASPTISAGDRYKTGESGATPAGRVLAGRRSAGGALSSRQRESRHDGCVRDEAPARHKSTAL